MHRYHAFLRAHCSGSWLFYMSAMLALSETNQTTLCGQLAAIAKAWQSCFFPWGVGLLVSIYSLLEQLRFRVSVCEVPRWLGLAVILLSLYPSHSWSGADSKSLLAFSLTAPWPAAVVLFWASAWRYALILLSYWTVCVLCSLGAQGPSLDMIFCLPGFGLLALNTDSLRRWRCRDAAMENR
jgi:hypothetical protein